MSGAFDKKQDKAKRREERFLKEQKEKRRVRIISIIVLIVFIIVLSIALFLNSKFVRQSLPAISVAGIDFSSAEFDYLYSRAYSDYEQYMKDQLGDYASSYLPAEGKSHSSQIYDYETEETWGEFLTGYTIDQISESSKYYLAAKENGFELPPDAVEAIDNEMASYASYAQSYNLSTDAFIRTYVARNMTEKSIRKVMEYLYTVTMYIKSVNDSFTYTNEQLAACYKENKEDMDSITFRIFLVKPEETLRQDYETDEEFNTATEEATAEAGRIASEIKSRITSEEDFVFEAAVYNAEDYGNPEATLGTYPGSALGSEYKDWLLSNDRQLNDVEVFDTSTGVYVVLFIDRDPNEYYMTEMRQVLILRDEVNPDDYPGGVDDPDFLAAYEAADAAALDLAEIARRSFIDGGMTEEAFIDVVNEGYSDDSTDGHYDLISKNAANNKMVPEIEDWLFAPGRQAGDCEIVRTEAFGYHLLYFVGFGDRYCDYLADTKLRDADYHAWEDTLQPLEVTKRWAFMFRQVF